MNTISAVAKTKPVDANISKILSTKL